MQEEISLREIIETIWNGKYLIIGVTIVAILISGVFSFFIIAPTYETTALLRVNVDDSNRAFLNSLIETTKSDVSIHRIIEKLHLQDQYTINQLRKRIEVSLINNTSVVSIKVDGKDPKLITDIANLTAFEFGARTEISDRSAEIVNFNNQLIEIDDQLVILQNELEEVEAQLAQTPEKMITNRSLAEDAFLLSLEQERSGSSNRNVGALELRTEEINPLYISLKSKASDIQVAINRALSSKEAIIARIDENKEIITSLENQIDNERLNARNSLRILSGSSAIFVSPAIEPTNPVAPNKLLNVAIAAIAGFMLSVLFVFIRQYWIATDPTNKNT